MTFLALLVAGHYLADYALQNAHVAEAKGQVHESPTGIHALIAHSVHHALVSGVAAFVCGIAWLPVTMLIGITHGVIDYGKAARGLFGIHLDQLLHLTVIILIAVCFGGTV